jgi:SAM-dependent methyltransferase
MPPRRTRKRDTVSSFDLYARAMLDHWLGKKVVFEFERDDGYRSPSLIESYFAPPAKWSKIEREAMKEVRGRVLDVGCGPGRHALYLQRRRHRVVGIDASPTQVALARVRGVEEVYQASVRRLPRGLGTFDTIILMGNNLGLAGDVPLMRRFLRDAKQISTSRGRIVGSTRIPGTWIPHHLSYVKWNVARGRPPGLLTLRGRYKGRVGDWFDLLLLSPDDLAELAHETGWDLVRVIYEPREDATSYVGVLRRRG